MAPNSNDSDMKMSTDERVETAWSTADGATPAEMEEAPPGHPLVSH
jgi:hypothetical protein